ncbi:uncharacterized protein FOMMEDRAFT_171179 [Fomitiporia mediterranea MF3/22]|uniref:uncharacterized protein n=1 Tax=Fomitiporia mediterranea (strain MF3/22) TaxID=694068 RepID=UPI00044088FF|nr:uncharacterized protein FOMMEDRAFT_171179 [Fomitiporia mediterranea MF3/22]EJC98244.1 hypothetical protein FOMMEDRAFT_171179 [Fomitiporia mediterranea MF3/22]
MSDDYDEEENQNVIIDCDILEAAKENIQPLASGRRVTALASVLKTPHGIRNAKLEATRERLRERVREAQARVDKLKTLNDQAEKEAYEGSRAGEDVDDRDEEDEEEEGDEDEEFTLEEAEAILLDAYVRLVTWIIEHYPRGQSAASGILEQLEEATRAMRHSEYAKGDPRYLNLWIRYASYVDHPEVIYEFLLANDIGTKWAKLYEEYASLLEKINRRPKADEIYLLGIARKAEPLEHLERRHRDFQKRMMVAAPLPETDSPTNEETSTTTPSAPSAPGRRPLAESKSTSAASSTPLTSASSAFDVFSAPSSSSSIAPGTSQGRARPNGRIPVYVDPEGKSEKAPGNAWPELGTRAERIKENRRVPEKMQGAVLKQKGAAKAATMEAAARARAAPKFVPYRDPPQHSNAVASSSRCKVMPATAAESESIPSPTTSGPVAKFVPYKDPEPESSTRGSKAKIVPFKDPEPVTSPVSQTAAKFVPFKDPDAGSDARRSKRLASKGLSESKSEPLTKTEEDELPANDKPSQGSTAKFVPYRDENIEQRPATSSIVPETVMRPKPVGLGVLGATREAEALRKDPFKNYKDL